MSIIEPTLLARLVIGDTMAHPASCGRCSQWEVAQLILEVDECGRQLEACAHEDLGDIVERSCPKEWRLGVSLPQLRGSSVVRFIDTQAEEVDALIAQGESRDTGGWLVPCRPDDPDAVPSDPPKRVMGLGSHSAEQGNFPVRHRRSRSKAMSSPSVELPSVDESLPQGRKHRQAAWSTEQVRDRVAMMRIAGEADGGQSQERTHFLVTDEQAFWDICVDRIKAVPGSLGIAMLRALGACLKALVLVMKFIECLEGEPGDQDPFEDMFDSSGRYSGDPFPH